MYTYPKSYWFKDDKNQGICRTITLLIQQYLWYGVINKIERQFEAHWNA